MIFCTSISWSHRNEEIQSSCIKSWDGFGKVYSFNSEEEIEQLEKKYEGVTFIEIKRTVMSLFGKPLTPINYFIDFAIENKEDLVIINSDILIKYLPVFKKDGVTMITRNDYSDNIEHSTAFVHGYDLFHIPFGLLSIYPPLPYGLGSTFWDISLPYRALKNNISLYWPQDKFIFHKIHENQYSHQDWLRTGEAFKWEFGIDAHTPVSQALQSVMFKIKSESIK